MSTYFENKRLYTQKVSTEMTSKLSKCTTLHLYKLIAAHIFGHRIDVKSTQA